MKKYWAGGLKNKFGRATARFLADYDEACASIATNLKSGGTAIFVVGRRSTGGYRLKLDKFTIDCLRARGFELIRTEKRGLQQKHAPRVVNRFARDAERKHERSAQVLTMDSEIIVVMKKKRLR
jgi:hypothetical protein